jgi:hypothetical protein
MNSDRDTLAEIDRLSIPRHFFVLPTWVESGVLDRLLREGHLSCDHLQRNADGEIQVAMGLQLTTRGKRLIHSDFQWQNLALKGSLAGASFTAMSLVILYLG